MKRIGVMGATAFVLFAVMGDGIGQTQNPASSCSNASTDCTQYTYDGLGRVIAAINQDGTGQIYTYDAAGNRITSYSGTPVMFTITPQAPVIKGQTLNNVVTITKSLNNDGATIAYRTVDGTAKAGINYTATSGTLVFASQTTTRYVDITTLNDGVYDGPLMFTLQLTPASSNATINYSATLITINEPSGTTPPAYSVSSKGAVVEGNPAQLRVTRSIGAGQAETVSYATSAGAASSTMASGAAGIDYVNTAGTLTFPPSGSSVSQTFTVPTISRPNFEGTRGFNVTLSAPSGGATVGAPVTQLITDSTPITFTVPNPTVTEGNAVSVPVTLGGGTLNVPVALSYLPTQSGTATPTTDYTPATVTTTFPAGSTTGAVQTLVPAIQTNYPAPYSGTRTFTIVPTGTPPGASMNTGTVTIQGLTTPGAPTNLTGTATPNGQGNLGPWNVSLNWSASPAAPPSQGLDLQYQVYTTDNGGTLKTTVAGTAASLSPPNSVMSETYYVVGCYTSTSPYQCGPRTATEITLNNPNGD